MSNAHLLELAPPIGEWAKAWEATEPYVALKTGFPALDRALGGGLLPGQILTVGANTGMGKSMFGVNLACRVAEQGKTAVIFTFEMMKDALSARVNQTYSGVNVSSILTKDLTKEQHQAVTDANTFLESLPLHISFGSDLTLDNLCDMMKRYRDEYGAELFVFDYIQKMDMGNRESRAFAVENAMQTIRRAAKEVVEVPVCILSQLGRAAGKSGDPGVYDLRDTGAIENESDLVVLIDPIDERPVGGWEDGVFYDFNLVVAKNRSGGGAVVPVQMEPHKVSFRTRED